MAASSSPVFFLLLLSVFAFLDVSNAVRKPVKIYELKKGDFSVKLTNWGATVVSVVLPDSKGKLADVALGFDTVASYVNDTTYFGAIVGRVANRIGGAKFTINGKVYKLFANDGNNTLHGGHRGFSKVIWSVTDEKFGDSPSITFAYHSFDGEQGFPGAVDASVTYKLEGDYKMSISMKAKSLNKPTPVNLASHTYWNLAGQNTGDILSNTIQIFSSHITPVDSSLIPTGEILSVKGTAYDFLKAREIGSKINQLPYGYDINYVLDASPPNDKGLRKAAVLKDGKSGRKMELWTNQPGMQLYTSHGLKNVKGKGGFVYGPSAAVCLETQGFPDSVNHPTFPNQIVNPGEVYEHYMLHKFSF